MTRTDAWRIVAGAFGFAVGAMWIAAGLTAAVGCLAAAGVGVAAVEAVRRRHAASGLGTQLRGRISLPEAARPRPAPARRPARRPRQPDWPSQESRYGW